ncbi:hypothetical protein PDESU_06379 [Pontiella desulfatans]|uniref:Uncharacterized protein n=1 Tax=Pontiella desulfatans TaxID=2750659 RepID=A0A6C2UE09_PONDE|nr:hypothetical protein [Pontiella desulfatans]VGO17777.1 hypothetical protein PDESU_06379 [Pontiella desulfatans]
MKIKNQAIWVYAVILFTSAHFNVVEAADSPWTRGNRIAISTDGNPDADADDVGATPFTLAMLAKAGLQDNLVHYDFNNFLEYKRIEPADNRMWLSAMGGQGRWGFDRRRFFDASIDPEGAVAHLAAEINKSTPDDPLYLIAAGPLELVYQSLEAADPAARKHAIIVSHHNYNEYFKPRLWQRNWNDVQDLVPGIGYLRIKDQNGWNGNGLKGKDDSDFHWLRDHADPNLNWVYERVVAGKPDVSDAGMLSWLIGINGDDEMVSIAEMQRWFGADPLPMNGKRSAMPDVPAGVAPKVVPPETQHVFAEVDGRIVIEAERVPLSDAWELATTKPGYSGSGYIQWMPRENHAVSHQHQGVLTYKLRITNAGNYRMALKSAHDRDGVQDQWSSCFTVVGLNPVSPYGITRKTGFQAGRGAGFNWVATHNNYGSVRHKEGAMSEPLYDLTEGDHYFWICGRSSGFRIDKIHFFKEGVDGFQNDAVPETPILPGGPVDLKQE